MTSLKYFCEDRPDLHIIAAGSLLGLEYRDGEEDGERKKDGEFSGRCGSFARGTSYVDSAFKVFMLDVGLLSAMSDLDPAVILDAPRIFREFKGALTEQYVHQQIVAQTELKLHYWSTEDSQTEVDFIFQQGPRVCPLEAKAEDNVRSRSLKAYERRFFPEQSYRVSMKPYIEQFVPFEDGRSCRLVNVPLYAVGCFFQSDERL